MSAQTLVDLTPPSDPPPTTTRSVHASRRAARPERGSSIAVLVLAEVASGALIRPVRPQVSEIAARRVSRSLRSGEKVEIDAQGDLVVHLNDSAPASTRPRVLTMTRSVVAYEAETSDGPVTVEAGAGVVPRRSPDAEGEARAGAFSALDRRDLVPRPDIATGRILRPWSTPSRWSNALQVTAACLLAWVLPFGLLVAAYSLGLDISPYVYLLLVIALAVMATMQWAEIVKAFGPLRLPPAPEAPAPRASALIAAYLPNEAETIVETVKVFLALEYSGPLQVVLAYNTPRDLPVEDELADLAAQDPRLVLIRVPDSTSKSENINHAIPFLTGEFVGIFDADHHPARGAFERAWRWIGSGVDVVQGHCVIRNGDESAVSRLVAPEFEQIYGLSHPGRQRLHGFGVFGGSNGFWRLSALKETRFRTDFLTEDIEASIRAVRDGRRIVNDPGLLSRELAPTTLRSLWRQRMRWAQGWLQVTVRHAHGMTRPWALDGRQRFGLGALLVWRELFPWMSSLMWPLLAFFIWRDGGLTLNVTLLWLTTLYTLTVGPLQIVMARLLAAPEIRGRTSWWWGYGFATVFFYAEWKNLIARVAQMKQLMGEHQWVVTPRSMSRPPTSSPTDTGTEVTA